MLSAVILTKNAEETLEKCLHSLTWCDELVVLDDNSSDGTVKIAKKLGAIVISHELHADFSEQRNFALEKTKGDWIFFVDADEVVTDVLRGEIQQSISDTNVDGFLIKRIDDMWGKKLLYGEYTNMWLLRLARKGKGEWQGKVHEVWEVNGAIKKLQNPLLHYPHPNISEFLKEINFYSTLRAQELFEKHIQVSWWDIILYPKAKFLMNYLVKQGFRDGIPGFLTAIIMSFHSFLVRGKLWQQQHSKS